MNNSSVFRTWLMLRVTYTLVPIALGLDKCFTGLIVEWPKYVSPLIMQHIPLTMSHFLILIGVIEILAGVVVWFRPRLGAYVIVAWMTLIIVNLITMNSFFDI
ncbi:MAG: hypothetical protein NTW22_07425, partial [Proteobacteria bacterium]|nr:hypothetical protein [Pseudomonadota bacterium]